MIKTLEINTKKLKQVIDVTGVIQKVIDESGAKEGVCYIFVMHTTCCITTADLDPGTDLDMLDAIEVVIPKLEYRHPHDPSHTPDHIASSIIGPSIAVLIENSEIVLGVWQRIVLIELSGPRTRSLKVKIIK